MVRGLLAALYLLSPGVVLAGDQPRVWDVPQALEAIDLEDRVDAAGAPVAIHAVRSKEKVDALARHFRAQFSAAGLFLPPPRHLTTLGTQVQVTGLDPDTYIAYTVFLHPNPDGTTTCLLTETFLAEQRKVPQEVGFAPVMPGASGVVQTRTEGAQAVQYRVRASVGEVAAFHATALGAAGFARTGPGTFQKEGEVLQLSVRQVSSTESAVLVLRRAALAHEARGVGEQGR